MTLSAPFLSSSSINPRSPYINPRIPQFSQFVSQKIPNYLRISQDRFTRRRAYSAGRIPSAKVSASLLQRSGLAINPCLLIFDPDKETGEKGKLELFCVVFKHTMTRILVQRSSSSSSSNPSRPPSSLLPQSEVPQDPGGIDDCLEDDSEISNDVLLPEIATGYDPTDKEKGSDRMVVDSVRNSETCGSISSDCGLSQIVTGGSNPPPPPVPPPKPPATSLGARRLVLGCSNAGRVGSPRRQLGCPVGTRLSPSESLPSSPRLYAEGEGYNSADEQSPCFVSSYDDVEREHMFELEIRRTKGLEVKRMMEDGNCLFRAVADQVYGDPDAYDMARQMCIDYMERERDHFSQFITEGFTSYCKRKRRDKVYGNNVEIQGFCEMYNRPIHIYCYSTEPINIFHGSYNTDTPPIRLSYHHGNHYNSLVDPRRVTIGAGLGFSSLQGRNVDKDSVKAAIKAQQDQQIDNVFLRAMSYFSVAITILSYTLKSLGTLVWKSLLQIHQNQLLRLCDFHV